MSWNFEGPLSETLDWYRHGVSWWGRWSSGADCKWAVFSQFDNVLGSRDSDHMGIRGLGGDTSRAGHR